MGPGRSEKKRKPAEDLIDQCPDPIFLVYLCEGISRVLNEKKSRQSVWDLSKNRLGMDGLVRKKFLGVPSSRLKSDVCTFLGCNLVRSREKRLVPNGII